MEKYSINKILNISDYYLRSQLILKGFFSGIHRVPYKGSSAEFSQYREYIVGDDFEKIDWKVFLRTDKLYIKESEDETNTDIYILLDISKSMDFFKKFEYAKTLLFLFSYIGFNQGDNIGYGFFNDDLKLHIKPNRRKNKLQILLNHLNSLKPNGNTNIENVIMKIGNNIKRNTFFILISDCTFSLSIFPKVLSALKVKGCDVILFHINAKEEFDKEFLSSLRIEDLENHNIVTGNSYEQRIIEIKNHIGNIKNQCNEYKIDYLHLLTDEYFDNALHKFLYRRRK